jgi:hypothetical protein
MASAAALQRIAADLNARQRAYLLAAYDEDQRREARNRGPGGRPAGEYRWIEYGPVGAKWLDNPGAFLLRHGLERAGLVSRGTGATWAALEERGLLTTTHTHTGFCDATTGRPIVSLLVRLTTDGRKTARILKGEPLTRPKQVKPLSLSALRLIAYGQAHPEDSFDVHAPWGICPLDYLTALGICRGLIKRGLLAGDAPHRLMITDDGLMLDVTKEPNWRPSPPPRREIGAWEANSAMSADDDFFLMANLRPADTGLPMVIWVSERGHARHDVRVKVSQTHGSRIDPTNTATVTVRPTPRLIAGRLSPADLQAVSAWIGLNEAALVDYWDSAISTAELLQRLQPLAPRITP